MIKKSLLSVALAGFAFSALAVPAKQGVLEYPQPDGTFLQITLHGDEFHAWYETADGYVVLPASDGFMEYATLKAGKIQSTGVRAYNIKERTASQKQLLASIPHQQLMETVRKENSVQQAAMRAQQRLGGVGYINNYPRFGSPKAMVLLVEFKDIKLQPESTREAFQDLVSKPGYSYNGATGSALDYFTHQSKGKFTPDFQVFGPITLPQNEAFYGAEAGTAHDVNPQQMVIDACNILRQQQPDLDWSEFDNDGDGYVDSIFVFFAGYGQNHGAEDWRIWPHSFDLEKSGQQLDMGGVYVSNYACANEIQGSSGAVRNGIGTLCHEYSHVLGLPDYYSTNGSGSFTPGTFEVMDQGSYNGNSNTPPNYSAYSRYCMGWLNPRIITGSEDITLHPIDSDEAYVIPTDSEDEFYLLENRQQVDWDSTLPGHGMLIWHIDFDQSYWTLNKVNNETNHQRIDLIEADNVKTDASRSGDPFPGSSNVTRFTSTSNPAMTAWNGYNFDMPITNIHETPEGLITFTVRDGGERLTPVKAFDPENVTPVSFTARWEQAVGAFEYEVDICKAPLVVPFLKLNVKSETSVDVTGLDPNTEYSYVVRAISGDRRSDDSNRINVTTLPPTFEQMEVEPLEATDIETDHFTAQWNELEGTSSYYISVHEKLPVDPQYQTVDFTKTGNTLLPAGWSSSSNTTGSLNGYYGEAAPALRLTNSGDRINTPTFSDQDINSLSFWYRGNSTTENSSLLVEARVDGKWQSVALITPVDKSEAHTVEISNDGDIVMPIGAKAVRITFQKQGNGSVYVDDIKLGYGATYDLKYHPEFTDADQGTATSTVVTNLLPNTTYFYTVRAEDSGKLSTPHSREIKVTTADPLSVDVVEADGATIIARNGMIEVKANAGTVVKLYDMAGRLEATAIVDGTGCVRIPTSEGLHLVAPFGRVLRVNK